MNEINILYYTIENIKLQLKELRVLVEVSIKESDLVKEFPHSEDLEKDLESLRVDHCHLKEEWTLLDKNLQHIIINGGVRCSNSVHA
ncbi:10818_t:CDS:2 [Cetraspora pellucida]|uniref:10818_t:CDS:1 n=1 Tax=Cetraspora pellucida TaxID=1433469 RepID=A0ACA9LW96_9GLOM|nr:10818_t:CDS:2 [Cetraspora pellucida]